ncbi:GTPase activating protein, partial [Coemansia sp. S17]
VLWTDYLTDRFVLFVALAILQRHADVIMDHLLSPEEVLKYVQDLSETIDLNDALKGAEMCFYKVRYRVQVVEQARRERNLPLFAISNIVANTSEAEAESSAIPVAERSGAPIDPEVPLISFEWEEPVVSTSTSEEPSPALGGEANSNERTPDSSTEDNVSKKAGKERAPDAVVALPEISESVHNIFARGSKF